MPHINVSSPFPGITGLLEERLDSSEPIRDLTQALLRGPSSLTEGERELIASLVSSRNECRFCTNAHAYTAARYYPGTATTTTTATKTENDNDASVSEGSEHGMDFVRHVMRDHATAPVTERMHALLNIAALVQGDARNVDEAAIARARNAGATDLDIHDTVLTAALFCFYNRYVDGLASDYPPSDDYYEILAERLTTNGYMRRGLSTTGASKEGK